MSTISRQVVAVVVTITLLLPNVLLAGSSKHPMNENDALNLLLRTLKHDNVYAKRISLDCVTFGTVEITRIHFEFVLEENHTAKCGGDPDTNPVIDRYRVHRASGKIELYNVAADSWQPYNPAKIKG
jgi:hypothetical protein